MSERNVHIDEDCTNLTGHHKGDVFFNCTFDKLNGLVLENCDLNHSTFRTSDIRDAMNFTLTLNCFSANNVEYSPLLFDLILCLLLKTEGNTEKRRKLIDVIGRDRVIEILTQLKTLE